MATLADELLNDFEDSGDEQDDDAFREDEEQGSANRGSTRSGKTTDESGNYMDDEDNENVVDDDSHTSIDSLDNDGDTKDGVEMMQLDSVNDVPSISRLMKMLKPVLDEITKYQNSPPENLGIQTGPIEDNPQYKLLTDSNSLSTQIDSEILLVHKFIRDHYSTRFPELETLVTNPLDYAKTVAVLKNGPLDNIKGLADSTDNLPQQTLRSFLDGPTLLAVHLVATTTKGVPLDERELQLTLGGCQMTLEFDRAKKNLTDYVQSRMTLFTPNLTALIGSLTAAQLLNAAGGIKGLAKLPATNVSAMGGRRHMQAGLATNLRVRNRGYLYQSGLIQDTPTDVRRQAMRIVSAKLVLAARIDAVHQSRDGSIGMKLRDECLAKLEKLIEPPPNRGPRALPAPDDKPARKRGGRRARKAKEATAMTDLRKQQNRMVFGKAEREVGYGTGDGTQGLGMIGQDNDGRVRATQVDRKTMARLSKKNPGWGASGTASSLNSGMASSLRNSGAENGAGAATTLRAQGLRSSGVGGNPTAGTASSLAFTPAQGLELVDPKIQAVLKRKRDAENAGYFSSGTFTQINPGKTDGEGFKVPSLPLGNKTNRPPSVAEK